MIRREQLTVTTDGSGAGTVTSTRPVAGEILEIRQASAAWSATADYTITRAQTGGTVLRVDNLPGPFTVYPRGLAVGIDNTGGSAVACIPSDEHLRLVVAGATASTPGTIHVYYKGL